VLRYVALRDAGQDPAVPARRPRAADEFASKVEEMADRSSGKIRADVADRDGTPGSERTTRRAVAEAKDGRDTGGLTGRGSPSGGVVAAGLG
jgi:hypothetical protein